MHNIPQNQYYAIFRIKPIMSLGKIASVGAHNQRLTQPPNADILRKHLNKDFLRDQEGDRPLLERYQHHLQKAGIKPHRGGVLAYEVICGMTHGAEATLPRDAWATRSLQFVQDFAGKENVISADYHDDEDTPHLHIVCLPIVNRARRRRGPLPKGSAARAAEIRKVLSWSALVGRTTADSSVTYSGLQDKYADAMKPFGLQRGIKGGGGSFIPASELQEESVAIDRDAEPLMEILRNPAPLVAGLAKPTPADLADDTAWQAYKMRIVAYLCQVLAPFLAILECLLPRAKRDVFAARAARQRETLARERDTWEQRAKQAEQNHVELAAQKAVVDSRLADMETRRRPVAPLEAVEMLGAHVISSAAGGRQVSQVVTCKGDVLTLQPNHFITSNERPLSVIEYLCEELQCKGGAALLVLEKALGTERAESTCAASIRLIAQREKYLVPELSGGNSSVRLARLQQQLETHIGVSLTASTALIEQKRLTVDGRGRGVLLPVGRGRGWVFDVGGTGSENKSSPTDEDTIRLGRADSETAIICDKVDVALKIFDATLGNSAATAYLIAPASLTENRFNELRQGHRDTVVCASSVAATWPFSPHLVKVRTAHECVLIAAEAARAPLPAKINSPVMPAASTAGPTGFNATIS